MTQIIDFKTPRELQPELDNLEKTEKEYSQKVREVLNDHASRPDWKLYNCISQLESVAALVHVLYRSVSYADIDVAHDQIINQGLCHHGDSDLVMLVNSQLVELHQNLKLLYQQISAV